ncbi:MAG: OsmC family protein [Hyphomicrobiales bacterium]|nr:OsmC family protein [Hyphomicrobiales bacterium]
MSASADKQELVSVNVTRLDKYRFEVDFGDGLERAFADEPAPLGEGTAPSPVQWLASAVANCLAASMVFAFARYREDVGALQTAVTCEIGRNDKGRLRVIGLDAQLTLGRDPDSLEHLEPVLRSFADFCTVSKSVEAGIPLRIAVKAEDGRVLKQA